MVDVVDEVLGVFAVVVPVVELTVVDALTGPAGDDDSDLFADGTTSLETLTSAECETARQATRTAGHSHPLVNMAFTRNFQHKTELP